MTENSLIVQVPRLCTITSARFGVSRQRRNKVSRVYIFPVKTHMRPSMLRLLSTAVHIFDHRVHKGARAEVLNFKTMAYIQKQSSSGPIDAY